MKSSSGLFADDAYDFSLSRSGPTLPLVPAAASVWHAPQPLEANASFPAATSAPPPPPPPEGVVPVVVVPPVSPPPPLGAAVIDTPLRGPATAATYAATSSTSSPVTRFFGIVGPVSPKLPANLIWSATTCQIVDSSKPWS